MKSTRYGFLNVQYSIVIFRDSVVIPFLKNANGFSPPKGSEPYSLAWHMSPPYPNHVLGYFTSFTSSQLLSPSGLTYCVQLTKCSVIPVLQLQ